MAADEYRKKKTDKGRTVLRIRGNEESVSAKSNWDLWKTCKDLEPYEISFLITLRKEKIKYCKDPEQIRVYRTDILILEDAYRINNRRCKERMSKYIKKRNGEHK